MFQYNIMLKHFRKFSTKVDINKITNHISDEITKTKEYQTKVWADQKVKNAEMWSKLKSLFAKN